METTKILFIAANPVDTRHLALDEEFRRMREMLRTSSAYSKFELIDVWAARPDDWLSALNAQTFRVVHFSGHGTGRGTLQHVGSDGLALPVSLQALKAVFRDLKGNICLVVLNACYSRKQAEVIAEEIDCVISMNDTIHDEAAITFIGALYRALFSGKSVYNAFEQGKAALMLNSLKEDQVPELLVRSGIDATKVMLIPLAQRYRAFIGFGSKDKPYLNELHTHLEPYVQKGTVDYWDNTKMPPGAKWRDETMRALASTKVAILLLSANLLASDFVKYELPLLLEAEKREKIKILCVLLSACDYKDFGLGQFKLVSSQPLSGMRQGKREEIWNSVALQVRDILQTGP